MSFANLAPVLRPHLTIHRSFVICAQKVRHCSSVPGNGSVDGQRNLTSDDKRSKKFKVGADNKAPKWKKFDSEELGIRNSLISKPTQVVLHRLRKKGYEVYLVGGCVRDLILERTPKDFDIITSAELKEVKKSFSKCIMVGKRYPICHVHVSDTIVEVSSFSTTGKMAKFSPGFDYELIKPSHCDKLDYMRWRNCLGRDLTINSLIFDPCSNTVYDYLGAVKDIKNAKVRTVKPADISFKEDCARILRSVRIAARLGFQFTKEIAFYIRELASSVLRLDKGRILMEMHYMLAYGSAEASLRLLWRFGLLELLLPCQASYFVSQGFRRRDEQSNMLLTLFSNLDKLVAPDRPCHSSLWVTMLAFHKALDDEPQDPLVVAAFSLCVHSGGSLFEAIEIARSISRPHEQDFSELLQSCDPSSRSALVDQVINLAASVKSALYDISDKLYVSQAMNKYPRAPRSDMVFISSAMFVEACKIFECVRKGKKKGFVPKREGDIDYDSLAAGRLEEIQHVFARIVFDTVYPPNQNYF